MDDDLLAKLGGNADHYPAILETRFRRVFDRIVELWGSDGFDEYVSSLFINDSGSRQGFPEDAMAEIFRMSRLHDAAMARARETVAWESEAAKRGLSELNFEYSAGGMAAAIEKGRDDAVELFLRAGMDVETRNSEGWTPLMIASFHGSAGAAERLIHAGADVRARDPLGYTPCHWAAVQGYERVLTLLLARGAKANEQSMSGITPLMQAAAKGHVACVELLLAQGALPQMADNEGWTPLHKATANRHLPVIRLLIARGADPFAEHESGTRPIDIAKSLRDSELLRAFQR